MNGADDYVAEIAALYQVPAWRLVRASAPSTAAEVADLETYYRVMDCSPFLRRFEARMRRRLFRQSRGYARHVRRAKARSRRRWI